jgi:Flp pilus assembly protein TadG
MGDSRLSDPGTWRRLRGDCRGSTAIEAAVILPMFLLLIFACMEFANMMWTQNSLNYAVMRAARCAAIDSGTTGACNGQTAVQTYAAGLTMADGVTLAAFNYANGAKNCPKIGDEAATYQVTASYTYKPLLGKLVPLPTIKLTAMACYPG